MKIKGYILDDEGKVLKHRTFWLSSSATEDIHDIYSSLYDEIVSFLAEEIEMDWLDDYLGHELIELTGIDNQKYYVPAVDALRLLPTQVYKKAVTVPYLNYLREVVFKGLDTTGKCDTKFFSFETEQVKPIA